MNTTGNTNESFVDNSPRYEDCNLADGSRLISIEVPGYAVSELSVILGDASQGYCGHICISGKRKNIQTKKIFSSNTDTEFKHNTEFSLEFQLEEDDTNFYVSDVYLIKSILYISVEYKKKILDGPISFKIHETCK